MALTLKEIAEIVNGQLKGREDLLITGVNSLELAKPGEISYFKDKRYKHLVSKTKASALFVSEETDLFKGAQIIVPNPALALAKIANYFLKPPLRHPGISKHSYIGENTRIGKDASIYPFVYIGNNVSIGDNANIFPGVFVGDNVKIGDNVVIYPNVVILNDTVIGNNVIIHSGTVIGSDGFGFERDGEVHIKIPQKGFVQIDDDVEIGAGNCIDRATFGKTWIKRGVKTDNLVHIAHNVVVGENSLIIAQAGISGSVVIGKNVIIAGQVGIVDHVEIGDHSIIGPQSGVPKSIPAGSIFSGTPAMPHPLFLKTSALIQKLPDMHKKLLEMEKKIKKLEEREKR
ncbi:MAG: UDP-3-O-(3-hydroxymyristoyl)glucosamine N-acyltransferase [Deltaproteobacteria bacterium]|nr:MAG: UDP-3-O-(3-hydroxymyristoyl)glucosamine N-acyltransferase [Deltaproteobacteria bacterium]